MNVFDFDNTIYKGDSTADFYLFCLRRHPKIIALAPGLLVSLLRFKLRKTTKTQFKSAMFGFLKYADLTKDINDFWDSHIKNIKDFYKNMQSEDDVIASASPEFLLEPACKKLGIKYLIASKVDKDGVYEGINCSEAEKARRFKERFGSRKIDCFYSDSYNDTPLAVLARHSFMVSGENISDWKFKTE